MRKARTLITGLALAVALATAAGAQLLQGLPRVGGVLDQVGPLTDSVTQLPDRATRTLESARLDRIAALVRANPDRIAIDPQGFPARAHEVVVNDPDDALIAAATGRGYRLIERGEVLGVGFARFEAPGGPIAQDRDPRPHPARREGCIGRPAPFRERPAR